MRRLLPLAALVAAVGLVAACAGAATRPKPKQKPAAGVDWARFGFDAARHDVGPQTGITAANVGSLLRMQVHLDGTVDSSPIYLHGVTVKGHLHDVFVVTTTYGKTEAIDASNGRLLWRFTPPGYASWAGSARITNATPVADPSRTAVYAAAPDGRIRKLRLSDGKALWSTAVTLDPTHEKLTSSLNVGRGLVLVTTGGYIGDAPPYQGHVVTLFAATGKIDRVWNSLCSNQHQLIVPSSCGASDSAIWSRSGVAVDPSNGDLVVATGNGPFNGSTNWGDSVLVLSPDASTLLRHYTPVDQAHLNKADLDLGSTSPSFLTGEYVVQGGKDGNLRLLDLSKLPGVSSSTGGELQTVPTPGGAMLFSQPTVWQGSWVFLSDSAGTAAWRFTGGRLQAAWSNGTSGTTPVVAGGLLYVAGSGSLNVYAPTTGKLLAQLPTGPVHWQSPVAADGRVAVAEGNANDHATTGVLDVFRLP